MGDFGRSAIILAALLFTLAVIGWLLAPRAIWLKKASAFALGIGVFSLFGAFISLGILFANNRFEYAYIFQHGDTSNALQYRIAGIWSGQQGSFLLWACAAGLFALFTAKGTKQFRRWYSVAYGTFLAGLAGILAFESPFGLNNVGGLTVVPPNGAGLAPSLQNYWVTIHPPTIFLGFGALTVLFCYAFAALMEADTKAWLPLVRPWALVASSLLGLGLCMGGFWAYETLGWGGFWMWDPVENVSFVPWCLAIAFTHGIVVQIARGTKKRANLLMGGLPFITFMYGTFLTRSGFLADASVHSFAEMNRSALKLLIGLMAVSFISFFGMLIFRAVQEKQLAKLTLAQNPVTESLKAEEPSVYGRESLINVGIATVSAIGIATMIGMSVPFFQALQHQPSKVVEEGLYHQVLTWFFVPTMILMAVAPFAPWKNATGRELASRFYSIACMAIGFTGMFLMFVLFSPFGKMIDKAPKVTLVGRHELPGLTWLLFLVGICSFAIIGNIWRIWQLRKASRLGWSPFLAHIGVVVLMIGLIISRGFEDKGQAMVMKEHPGKALGYEFRYRSMTSNDHDRNNKVLFDVYSTDEPKQLLFTATPGMYKVPGDGENENTMVWPSIIHRPLYDVYVSLRPPENEVSEPISLKPGQATDFGGLNIRYDDMAMNGQPGQAGTAFIANLTIQAGGRVRKVQPSIQLGGATGPIHNKAALDESLNVEIASINAADRSVSLQFQLSSPMYPIDVYHKPMVGLVWLGTGLMTVAGLLAAAYRRVPSMATAPEKAPVPAGTRRQRLAKQNS
jgi:cytochrome c-type biogenesis protein CcmF